MNPEDLQLVFFGLTFERFMLAAGQYAVFVSSVLLVAKHAAWWARGYHTRRERRRRAHIRAAAETIAALALAILYGQHLYFEGALVLFGGTEAIVQSWSVALLFFALVLSRAERGRPSSRSR